MSTHMPGFPPFISCVYIIDLAKLSTSSVRVEEISGEFQHSNLHRIYIITLISIKGCSKTLNIFFFLIIMHFNT